MAAQVKRYLENNPTTLLRVSNPRELLIKSLQRIVTSCPPSDTNRRGLFAGPTSIAYLFYHLSLTHFDLSIEGKSPRQWMEAYLDLPQPVGDSEMAVLTRYGIVDERLCWTALRAVAYQQHELLDTVVKLGAMLPSEGDSKINELLFGGAGALVVLRMVRTFAPSHAEQINTAIASNIKVLLERRPWTLRGNRYLGPGHGDVGIIAQIVLSDHIQAKELKADLAELLDLQQPDGNWPVAPDEHSDLVQWCHGAPGFVIALEAIKELFPSLRERIEQAVSKARRCVWERGLLVKEPNLCHGITGNALALKGEQKEHFLALTTPEKLKEVEWEPSKDPWCLFKGEAGRAWVWAQLTGGNKGFPAFTDI
ncbi:MAG: hypothetical protein GOMPHAMPRED_003624 [Gomphillus americanus]|uniref:Uncharacterized protein n=1 Tax=Gomphillus americanus TaxID=1940652 RepID=A0A8H3FH61_9LECA|nr:MAG: hypothetical protein GOMPHAMPRED_003624 [Gomphillus americanus]